MSEYLNPPKSSFQHPILKIKKGNASTWREQNGYLIAKVKKYLESHNDFTNFFRIMSKKCWCEGAQCAFVIHKCPP